MRNDTISSGYTEGLARTMEREWGALAVCRRYRQRLRTWAIHHEALDFSDGITLIKGIRGAEAPALAALAQIAVDDDDDLALRTAVQILLPRLVSLSYRGFDVGGAEIEERLAQLIELAIYFIRTCDPGTAGTPYDFRLWANIRRAFVRRDRAARLARVEDFYVDFHSGNVDRAMAPDLSGGVGELDLRGLSEWVADIAQVSLDTAALVTLTRAWGIVLADIAEAEGVASDRLRQRRMRAERKLSAALALAS